MSVGAFAELAHHEIDALVAERGAAVVSGGTGLYLRAALADIGVPPPVAPELRARIAREVDDDRDAAHRRLADLDPSSGGCPSARSQASRPRARARGDGRVPCRWPESALEWRDPPADARRRSRYRARSPRAADPGAHGEDVRPGRCRRGARGDLGRRVSRTAEKTLGLEEIARLGPDALDPIVVRTRRYAAYQRKWMRRIPDLVYLDAAGPPGEIADDVVSRARG